MCFEIRLSDDKASRSAHGMLGETSISRVASACRPHSQCASQFQRGHHTLGSSLFKTAYLRFSSIFEELASTTPSPLPQIPQVSSLCQHIISCLYLPSQGSRASSSKSCWDFTNLYAVGLTLCPSCSETRTSKGVQG